MRKKFLGALIAAVTLLAGSMTVFAAPASTTVCTAYVDADGNGICDNYLTGNGCGRGRGGHISNGISEVCP